MFLNVVLQPCGCKMETDIECGHWIIDQQDTKQKFFTPTHEIVELFWLIWEKVSCQ